MYFHFKLDFQSEPSACWSLFSVYLDSFWRARLLSCETPCMRRMTRSSARRHTSKILHFPADQTGRSWQRPAVKKTLFLVWLLLVSHHRFMFYSTPPTHTQCQHRKQPSLLLISRMWPCPLSNHSVKSQTPPWFARQAPGSAGDIPPPLLFDEEELDQQSVHQT